MAPATLYLFTRQIPMTPHAHPIELAAIAAVGLARVARAVLVPVLALVLTLAGWQPSRRAATAVAPQAAQPTPTPVAVAAPAPAPVAVATVADLLDCRMDYMTVAELRQVARAAGHRSLARSGRRSELVAALALA